MNKEIVLTLTGHDRVGIVKEITNVLVIAVGRAIRDLAKLKKAYGKGLA